MFVSSVIALVAATAGFPTTFIVTVRDSFGNPSDSHTLQRFNPLQSATTVNPTSVRFEIVISDTVIRKVKQLLKISFAPLIPSLAGAPRPQRCWYLECHFLPAFTWWSNGRDR